MFPNAKGSELFSVLATIDPASQAVGTTSTGWISAGNHHNLLALIQSGALGTNATLDAKLQQAQDASGTGAKDLTGKAITQLTQAGTDSDKQALINLRASELDLANSFTHFRLSMTIGTATSDAGGVVLAFDGRAAVKGF